MENKSLLEVVDHLESLGIVDKEYAQQLRMQEMSEDAHLIGITFSKHENNKVNYMFSIAMNPENKGFEVLGCEARTLIKPEVIHDTIHGINTRELEDRFAGVQWDLKGLPLPMESKIFSDLITLNNSGKIGQDIAERLMIKYWHDTPMDKIFSISPIIENFIKSLKFPIRMDVNDITDKQVYNLLCGRSVMKFDIGDPLDTKSYWIKEENGKLILLKDFDISKSLNQLPFVHPQDLLQSQELLLKMSDGGRVLSNIKIGAEIVSVYIEADPSNARIAVFDKDQNLLNETLDKQQSKDNRNSKQVRPAPRSPRKGRGI